MIPYALVPEVATAPVPVSLTVPPSPLAPPVPPTATLRLP
jgi:hypothetical protein